MSMKYQYDPSFLGRGLTYHMFSQSANGQTTNVLSFMRIYHVLETSPGIVYLKLLLWRYK